MWELRGSETYQRPLHLPPGWPGLAFVVLWGLGFGSAVLMVPFPIGLVFGLIGWGAAGAVLTTVIRHLARQKGGIRLDPDGITELAWFARPRRVPWSEVRAVEAGEHGATILTSSGSIVIDIDIQGWPRLVSRVRSLLQSDSPRPVEGELISNEEVAEWLGISPEGSVVCRPRGSAGKSCALLPAWLLVTAALSAFYYPFFKGALSTGGLPRVGTLLFVLAHASIFFGVFSGGLLVALLKSLRPLLGAGIRADVTGLELATPGGKRHYSWAELYNVEMRDGKWWVTTADDEFSFEPGDQNAARLVNGLQRAVASRREGRELPRMGPIPDGAISLAEDAPAEVSLDRGLSQTDEPGGG